MSNYIKMVDCSEEELMHTGRKGMKWGQHIFGKIKSTAHKNKKQKYVIPAEPTRLPYDDEEISITKNSLKQMGYKEDPTYGWHTKQTKINNKPINIMVDNDDVNELPMSTLKKVKEIEKDLPEIHKAAIDKIVKDYYEDEYMSGEWLAGVSKKDFINRLEPSSVTINEISYYSPDYDHWLSAEYRKTEGKYKAGITSMNG